MKPLGNVFISLFATGHLRVKNVALPLSWAEIIVHRSNK